MTDQVIKGTKSPRTHATRRDAFECMKRHLVKQGYTRVGQREFAPSDGGPVLVLDKKSRYGGLMVSGKGGDKGKRFMPEKRRQGNRGLIV